jgi:hypothetical protein
MAVWSEVGDILSDPVIISVIIAGIIALVIYRRQAVLNRRIELQKDYKSKLDELYQTLSSTITSYNEVINLLANIGDKYRHDNQKDKKLDPATIQAQAKQAGEDVDNKYNAIKKLIEDADKYQSNGTEIINELSTDPMIVRNFATVANTLNKHHVRIGSTLSRANNLLIWINPLPPDMAGGQNTSPQLFQAIRDVIYANVEDLKQFQLYVQDTKKLLYNELVGGAFMFKKYKPSYTEQRSALTNKGIRDYSVESSRWMRMKLLARAIWN